MGAVQIAGVKFWHDAIIDSILASGCMISQGELARMHGYSETWISIICNSDAFKERLAERKGELIDPSLRASQEERVAAVAKRALDRLMEKLDGPGPFKVGELTDIVAKTVGIPGPKIPQLQQNNFVFQIPPPAKTAEAWISQASRRTVDVSHVNPES
jgi:hypothetical protein